MKVVMRVPFALRFDRLKQVKPDPSLELVPRTTPVDGVFDLEVVSRFIEANSIQLGVPEVRPTARHREVTMV